jgi:hypothetical protein
MKGPSVDSLDGLNEVYRKSKQAIYLIMIGRENFYP